MLTTSFTDLVGCTAPVQQAGMGGVGTKELAAAVAGAGGLGMVSMAMVRPDQVASELDSLGGPREGAIGLNILMPFLDPAVVEAAASRLRVVEFFYGDPDASLVRRVHDGGALAAWQAGSVGEARAAADAGCDFVVAQGSEAGGHVRGRINLLPLLDGVLDAVDVPVVAAGGISTARGLAAVLAAGASAARVGTRFVATHEANVHPLYAEALLHASAGDTVLTETFSVMWPDAPHRVLRSCVDAAGAAPGAEVGEMLVGPTKVPVPKFSVLPPTRETTGSVEAMALYAGQSVGTVTAVVPAADVVRELVEGAERLLRGVPRA